MSSRYDESSMSSLSAAQSAYNAAEPKPLSSSASARSRQSHRSNANASYAPGSNRGGPRSVDGRSAQSVASALSHGSAGRGHRSSNGVDDDERSNNTQSLIGQVHDMTLYKLESNSNAQEIMY